MEYIVSTECKYYGNKKYMVIPRQFVSKDLFMVYKKSDLPKCNYPVRIATDWNQGWGISNCLPKYDMFGDAYAEIWPMIPPKIGGTSDEPLKQWDGAASKQMATSILIRSQKG